MVSSVASAITRPIQTTPNHMDVGRALGGLPRLAGHDVLGLRVDAHRECRADVDDEVDPQDLRCQQGSTTASPPPARPISLAPRKKFSTSPHVGRQQVA